MTRSAQALYEHQMAEAMRAADPVAALRAMAEDVRLPADVRERLAGVDEDGVQLTAMIVARMRFERLMRGSPEAEAWFEEDGEDFAKAFRDFHRETPLSAFFPADEAELFERWCLRRETIAPR